jgi:4-hydroxy-tetrahydrodipicolinate synthase
LSRVPVTCLHISASKALKFAGTEELQIVGTTSEGPSFSVDERRTALEGLVRGGVPAERRPGSTAGCVSDPLWCH